MGTLLSNQYSRTAMVAIFSTTMIILGIEGLFVNSQPTQCCKAKTVGEFSYTLAESSGPYPGICTQQCAYTRDNGDGSLYCFAPGSLPVECLNGEKPEELLGEQSCNGLTCGPFGNLPGEKQSFNDSTIGGTITDLILYHKKFNNGGEENEVVVGIQVTYDDIQTVTHGDTSATAKACPSLSGLGGLQYTKVVVYSKEDIGPPNQKDNQIYGVELEVAGQSQLSCQAGSTVGKRSELPDDVGNNLAYFSGEVLSDGTGLQSIIFVFKSEEMFEEQSCNGLTCGPFGNLPGEKQSFDDSTIGGTITDLILHH